jgi:hypothetical protein
MWIVEFKTYHNQWIACGVYPYPDCKALAVFSTRKDARVFRKERSVRAEGIKYRIKQIDEIDTQ